MARVALVQRFLPSRSRGGVGYFAHGLATTLSRRGHDVAIFSQDPAPAGSPYRTVDVPIGDGRLAPFAFPWALRRADFSGFDVIHAQGDEQFLPRRGRPPVVRTLHGTALAEAWYNGLRAGSIKRLAMHGAFYAFECLADLRADRVAAVSHHTTHFYPRVHAVIPNGIDTRALAPSGAVKSAAPSVLFVGEIDSRKRGRLLIDVFAAEVRRALPGSELWLVSPDRVDGDGIRWFGRVDDGELRRLLQEAWVMCLPSAYEGFGRPYAEAMSAGTVAVASPNPGAREVLGDGRFGVIAEDARLGQALIDLLRSPERRAALEAAGLARARDFDWDVVAAAYEQLYAEAMGTAP